MIYVIEGADGTGKTTLGQLIAEKTKGCILHSIYAEDINMRRYHSDVMEAAMILNKYQDVVIDRWSLSEHIYGKVYRETPSYDVMTFMSNNSPMEYQVKWIYCRSDHTQKNHLINRKKREELYPNMDLVQQEYDEVIAHDERNWIVFDYEKMPLNHFLKGLLQ